MRAMRPLRLLQLATGLLLLPLVLAGAIFLGSLAGLSGGALVLLLTLALSLVLPLALVLGVPLGLLALVWAARLEALPQMLGWVFGFLLALGGLVLALRWLAP